MVEHVMTQALYNKWRPQKWDEVVGQQHVIQTLRNAVTGGHVTHAYLFAGPRGTGKTTVARMLAKAINCLDPHPAARPCNQCACCVAVNESRFLDLIEIDAASNTSVEDVRDLRDKINFTPNQGKYKVYIIDEVHMLSTAAFNALLKTLEEPPSHAIFILATTEIHKIPATVLSRCQRHEFRRIPVDDIVGQLKRIIESEKLTAEPEALTLIARQSAGGMRDAISLLDQMSSTGKEITLGLTQSVLGTATSHTVIALVAAVLDRKPSAGMDAIHAALDAGTDPRLLARQVVDYLRALLLIQMDNLSQADLTADIRKRAEKHARAFSPGDVLRMIKSFNAAAADLRGGWQPSLPLELAMAECLEILASAPAAVAVPVPAVVPLKQSSVGKKPGRLEDSPGTLYQVTAEPKGKGEKRPLENMPSPKKEAEKAGENPMAQSESGISLSQVAKSWKQVYLEVNKVDKLFAAVVNSCKPLEIKNNILTIGFNGEINRLKADTPDHIELIRKAIAAVYGVELALRCVVSKTKQTIPPDVKEDGMVAAALKAGGEIVDTQE
jgi:DNA polymerase-3 subunit gamma/tau